MTGGKGLPQTNKKALPFALDSWSNRAPRLARPYADTIRGSKFANMRDLRVQHEGRPYRVLYAFDPRRAAMLLLGGGKTGNAHWYEEIISKAGAIFTRHLLEIEKERKD